MVRNKQNFFIRWVLHTYVLWTIDGADTYMISTMPLSIPSPKPAQASLTLKLISRVGALR